MKRIFIGLLCSMFALNGMSIAYAQEDEPDVSAPEITETEQDSDPVEQEPETLELEQQGEQEIPTDDPEPEPTPDDTEPEITVLETPEDTGSDAEDEEPILLGEGAPLIVSGTQQVQIIGEEWGPGLNKTIITFDQDIDATSLDINDFTVIAQSGVDNPTSTPRIVEAVYTSDVYGNPIDGNSAYVAMDLYISPNDGGTFSWSMATWRNTWAQNYKNIISLSDGAEVYTSNGELINDINVTEDIDFDQAIYPQLTNVALDTYANNGVTIPYAFYAPQNDGQKHGIIIWNHGVGEGGTDPRIAILGNEVTALWDTQVQSHFDGGVYVLAAQVPNDGARDANRANAIMDLVRVLAANDPNIDLNRVYVAGCSAGGGMTVTMMKTNPDFFAAAVPICPAGTFTEEEAEANINLPTWFIHAENDDTVSIDRSTVSAENILKAGGEVHESYFADVHETHHRFDNDLGEPYQYSGHWSWIYFFNDEVTDANGVNIFDWMADQTNETATGYATGVTLAPNTDYPDSDALQQATFTYVRDPETEKQIETITVAGNFQFYTQDQRPLYDAGEEIIAYSAYEYKNGMFNTGYDPGTMSLIQYELVKVAKDVYQVTIPLPSTEYYYDFNITYYGNEQRNEGTITIQDPSNPSPKSPISGNDSGHSLLYVGSADSADLIAGQEEIYARNDQNGTVVYRTYTAEDGTTQPMTIYLPYNYDSSKEYRVLYISHGGGGNEAEWMEIGSAKNIFDNLIAKGEVKPTIVVALNHTYFGWNYERITDNLMNHVIPLMESEYNASADPAHRAFAGLSMGGLTTTSIYSTNAGDFGYFGIWSATNGQLDVSTVENADYPSLMLAVGVFDFGKSGYPGLRNSLDANGIAYDYYEPGGAHDWGLWRELLTIFARDYLWENDAPETVEYEIIEGANQTVQSNSSARFKSNAPFEKFVSVTVDGTTVDPSNYTVSEGSTVVVLSKEYIGSLSVGTHSFAIVSNDGLASTTFTIAKAENKPSTPKTDDKKSTTVKTSDSYNTLYFAIGGLLIAGIIGIFAYKKRREYSK